VLDAAGASAPSALIVAVPLATAQASPTPSLLEKDTGVVTIESDEDEDTGEGVVFKRRRVLAATTSHSTTNNRPTSFRDHPRVFPPPGDSSRSKVVGERP